MNLDLEGFGVVLFGFVILRFVFGLTRLRTDLANALAVSIPLAVGFTHSLYVKGHLRSPLFVGLTGLVVFYSFFAGKKLGQRK